MKKDLSLILCVIGLSGIIVLESAPATTQPMLASSEQETAGEQDEPQDQSAEEDGSETPEPEPTNDEPEPSEVAPTAPQAEQEQQEQLVQDIVAANEMVPVNETSTSSGGTTEREVTCVQNNQGQIFCYEPLPTEENCLKPINVEDPPLCLPKGD